LANERWRRPVVPLGVEHQPTQVIYLPDGRRLGDVVFVLSEEDRERLRLGYVCIKCFEPFEHAWPERCPVCGAPIRTKQAEFFAQEAVSKPVHLGPSTTLADERAGLEERRRKEEEKKR
jgi:DNA-directed RNA polymerase subunit RPC12/RpoP